MHLPSHLGQSFDYRSPRLAWSHYCQQLTLSVWHKNFKLLLFCFSTESSHFLAVSSPWPPLQNVFLDFLFRHPNAQNLHLRIFTKSPISWLVWQIDETFGPTRGFSGMANSMEPCKILWGRPLLPWQWNLHKIAYKSACMTHRLEMFGPTRGFSGIPDSMELCKNVVGPTLVAMATKFALGAEIKSPTGL